MAGHQIERGPPLWVGVRDNQRARDGQKDLRRQTYRQGRSLQHRVHLRAQHLPVVLAVGAALAHDEPRRRAGDDHPRQGALDQMPLGRRQTLIGQLARQIGEQAAPSRRVLRAPFEAMNQFQPELHPFGQPGCVQSDAWRIGGMIDQGHDRGGNPRSSRPVSEHHRPIVLEGDPIDVDGVKADRSMLGRLAPAMDRRAIREA